MFEAKLVPEAMKMAGASRNEYIRSFALLPLEGSCGKVLSPKTSKLAVKFVSCYQTTAGIVP